MTLVADMVTKASPEDIYAALEKAWPQVCGDEPCTRASLIVCVTQWALETGWGKACHCWNFGNEKADGHRDYCQFPCGEEVRAEVAAAQQKADPAHVKIVGGYTRNGVAMCSVNYLPPHPVTSFVAFATIDDGALDYLRMLHGRFAKAWPAVLAGDVAQFSHLLHEQHYYTADEARYTRSMLDVAKTVDGMIPLPAANPDDPHS